MSTTDLANRYLYGILDLGYVAPESALAMAAQMLEGGVDLLQIRAKKLTNCEVEKLVKAIHPLAQSANVPLIVNDFPALAQFADGAHVGQDDMAVSEARALAKKNEPLTANPIIGKSTHNVEQAIAAEREGADYIGFGPLFATPTKPDYAPIGLAEIRRVHELVKIPIFCIGGIKLENLASVLTAGAQRVVIVSGILQAADVPAYCREARSLLVKAAQPKRS